MIHIFYTRKYYDEIILEKPIPVFFLCAKVLDIIKGEILYHIQKIPGELEMAFTTAISSLTIFVEGKKRHITNPSENISKKSKPNKWTET